MVQKEGKNIREGGALRASYQLHSGRLIRITVTPSFPIHPTFPIQRFLYYLSPPFSLPIHSTLHHDRIIVDGPSTSSSLSSLCHLLNLSIQRIFSHPRFHSKRCSDSISKRSSSFHSFSFPSRLFQITIEPQEVSRIWTSPLSSSIRI